MVCIRLGFTRRRSLFARNRTSDLAGPDGWRVHQVWANSEEILHDAVNGEEALRVAGRPIARHLALALPGRLTGELDSIVLVLP